jgi:molybdopterin molybdotransferase
LPLRREADAAESSSQSSSLLYHLFMPPSSLLSFEDARHLVEHHASQAKASGTRRVALLEGIGLALAEPLMADRDFPPFPRATRDGYALRSADLVKVPAKLKVIGELKAGVSPAPISVQPGEAVSIMTGAAVPTGGDAVVMVEYTSLEGDVVSIERQVSAGENIVPAGAEAKRGNLLISSGASLDQFAVSVAASVGKTHLEIHTKPRVAILATGDEIVDIASHPGPHQIRNSNTYSLAAQIIAAGGQPLLLPVAPDEPERLRELVAEGLKADLLLLSGGVSMGKYDLVEQALTELGAEFFFTGVKIQPGKPAVFGGVPLDPRGREEKTYKYFFGLPGNPVSTMVTFDLFARPLLQALAGFKPSKLVFLHARLKSEINPRSGLKRFLPAMLTGEFENAEVELIPWHGSGDIAATARANCYLVIAADRERLEVGEWVPVLAIKSGKTKMEKKERPNR